MHQSPRSAWPLLLVLPLVALQACGDDDGDDPSGGAGTSSGGTSEGGSRTGSGGSKAGSGGSDGGTSGQAGESTGGAAGSGATSGGAAGGDAAGGEGGVPAELGSGTRYVRRANEIYITACECMVDTGAYENIYECAVDQGYSYLSEYTGYCLDDLAEDSSFLDFYFGCAGDVFESFLECIDGKACEEIVGSRIACAEGGMATPCNGLVECEGGADEEECPAEFECDEGATTIPSGQVCSGYPECEDESDEADCPETCVTLLQTDTCGTPSEADNEKLNVCTSF